MFFFSKNLPQGQQQLRCRWVQQGDRPDAPLVAVWTAEERKADEKMGPGDRGAGTLRIVGGKRFAQRASGASDASKLVATIRGVAALLL